MNNSNIGIRSLDIETGLYKFNDPILDLKLAETLLIGKAASLASHLRGIQVIENYDSLKALAGKLGINATELVSVLQILQEIEYIRVVGSKRNPTKIEVLITAFENTYNLLGEKWKDDHPDEFEQKMISIINELATFRKSKTDIIKQYCLSKDDVSIITNIGENGGFLSSYNTNGEEYLFSPIYMEENPKKILEFLDNYNEDKVKSTLTLLNSKPGFPVVNFNNIEDDLIVGLMSNNIMPTPAITASGGKVNFLFAPYVNTTDKEMVRQARNVVSAVRYGEKFSAYSQLRHPDLFLERLLERGYIGKVPHSDIEAQYGVLRDSGLGRIEEIQNGRYRFYLSDTNYAKDVVRLAKSMITSNKTFDPEMQRGIIAEAWEERKNLSKYNFSEYIPNLSNIKSIKANFNKRKALPESSLTQKKVNEALNKLFINGGEPDVF